MYSFLNCKNWGLYENAMILLLGNYFIELLTLRETHSVILLHDLVCTGKVLFIV